MKNKEWKIVLFAWVMMAAIWIFAGIMYRLAV